MVRPPRTAAILPKPSVEVLPDPARRWLPATQAQRDALDCPADVLMLGGTLGSLKTSTILVDLIQERDSPRMVSYFFRRSYPSLEDAIRQSRLLFPQTGALPYNSSDHTWRWPSGAAFRFRHCKSEKDLYDNFGKEMSAIGIDQSEQFPEDYVRFLMTRNRSVDSGLKIRCRLGANPGGEGGTWHMHVFFNGVCPHCDPSKAPGQGKVRYDAQWYSDNVKIDLSVAYILSSVRQHNLLGPDYIKRIQMQHPATARALLDGCWKTFEGQYFDIWDYDSMTLPLQAIPLEWWLPHWTGTDYGYSGSAAASILFCRAENGTVYVLDEYPNGENHGARREDVRTFARNHYETLVKHSTDSIYKQPKRMEAMYIGTDSFAERGDLHTLGGQMNEELEPYNVEFSRIGDDRAGGAQLTYTMLQSGQLKIARNCTNLISSLESRLHDEKEPMKVRKQPTSHLCDYFDAFCHGLYGYLGPGRKPSELRIQERVAKLWSEDPTLAMHQLSRIKEEEEAEDKPQVYGGAARRMLDMDSHRRR